MLLRVGLISYTAFRVFVQLKISQFLQIKKYFFCEPIGGLSVSRVKMIKVGKIEGVFTLLAGYFFQKKINNLSMECLFVL